MVKEVTSSTEFTNSIKSDKLVVVDFFATWCGPCRMIAPELDKLAEENKDVDFIKVDVDKLADVAEANGISAMPTFLFFKGGVKVSEVVGASVQKIKDAITKNK